ncbi:DUF676 domain-containing protein [Mycena kentingensis (nom. inval.)]|nr:DUF676 domain-containing protein [Mycena kentingensis (nom. inval.)]
MSSSSLASSSGSSSSSSSSTHLVAIVHGMWGNTGHVGELARVLQDLHPHDVHVLRPGANSEDNTYDGIDWGGERVADEIVAEVEKLKAEGRTVTRFSITGYSLGGLVARYVIGILHQRDFFENITPVNFNTIATPHLGVPRLRSLISSLASVIGPRLLSRTGEQFFCVDKWPGSLKGRPLLEVMSDPDRIFYKALESFETIRIYANAVGDNTVPYVTAAIETHDPFISRATNGLEVNIDEKYPALMSSYTIPAVPPPLPPKPKPLTAAWVKSKRPRIFIPPPLRFRFPFNLAVYALIPILFPGLLSLILFRLSRASASSRDRVRLLEENAKAPGSVEKLAQILARLEQQVESAVVDLIEEVPADEEQLMEQKQPKEQPQLTPVQRRIAANLNTLPLKKEIAWFPEQHAHAVIVCRDIKNFETHKAGEGIVRHWANVFIV